ncbi:MAG TPA: aminoglycoside phosphotransferase family protein [Methylibium sp.]|nr:aminoglycoside phosphotransferase family protein [Methylibium sp.]
MSDPDFAAPEPALDDFLRRQGLLPGGAAACWRPLTGGVSSDIWRVDVPGRTLCVKRALAKLKVAADWQAPVNRNAYEWAWLQFAALHCPDNVPRPVAHDQHAGLFAMSFLPPAQHPVWKQQLLEGEVVVATAQAVGDLIGRLHAASAGDAAVARTFDADDNFHALRLAPYLVATAGRHPEVAARLRQLAALTAARHAALVHGDVSPKNILVGPQGPVLLDAECAWYGDPAFDLAFCLNHLLLKGVLRPADRPALAASFEALCAAYLAHVAWEPAVQLEARTAALLPGLLLARVDGKSPVEYLSAEPQRQQVRAAALPLLRQPVERLHDVLVRVQQA